MRGILALFLNAIPSLALAECPFSSEDLKDDAKVVAHIECKTDEMFNAADRAQSARKDMAGRLTEF